MAWYPVPPSAVRRLWAAIRQGEECWEWTGPRDHHGIPIFRVGNEPVQPARVTYALAYGAVPDGVWLSHACPTDHCCRPDHQYRDDRLPAPPHGEPADPGAYLLVQMGSSALYPAIQAGDLLLFDPRQTTPREGVVLAVNEAQGWRGIRYLVRVGGDRWSLVAGHGGDRRPIPLDTGARIVATMVGTRRVLIAA